MGKVHKINDYFYLKVEYQEGGKNQVQHQKEQSTDNRKQHKIQHHFILVTI